MQVKIIGLSGRAGTGKSTIARLLCEEHAFEELSLAGPLKRALSAMLDLPLSYLEDRATKEAPIDWLHGVSPRRLMQTLGTDWGRDMVANDMWLVLAGRRLDQIKADAERDGIYGIVISDVRFDDEADFVRNMGGSVWHVIRQSDAVQAHSSERDVFRKPGDVTLDNTGTLERLAGAVSVLISPAG